MPYAATKYWRLIAFAGIALLSASLTGCAAEDATPPDAAPPPAMEEPPPPEPPDLPPVAEAPPPPAPSPSPDPSAPESPAPSPPPPPESSPETGAPLPPHEPPGDYPVFPWPPPRASASYELPEGLLAGASTLGGVDDRLRDALTNCGYVERAYFAAPDGFALVTRLEQINPDGTSKPPPARWSIGRVPLREFSLGAYLRALFTANPGYYRVIAFVVTPHPFTRDGAPLAFEEMREFFREGANALHPALASRPYTDDVTATALVYEFERPEGEAPRTASTLLTDDLDKTGLLAAMTP